MLFLLVIEFIFWNAIILLALIFCYLCIYTPTDMKVTSRVSCNGV